MNNSQDAATRELSISELSVEALQLNVKEKELREKIDELQSKKYYILLIILKNEIFYGY